MNYPQLLLRFFGLRGNVKKTETEISRMQNEKLRTLLRYAWSNSAYYRRRFMEAGITEEQLATLPLCSFPTTDKAELLTHFDELVTVPELQQEALRRFDAAEGERQAAYLGKYHLVHTSGSTGKPSYFVYDEAAWSEMLLAIIRGALWNMSAFAIIKLLLRGPRIAYLAATDGRYGGALAVTDGVSGLRAKQLSLDIKTPLSEWVDRMRAFQPNIVIGYPSAIKILGELVEEGKLTLQVERIISCGEPLCANTRHYLNEVFHAPIINFYGAGESLALGVEDGDESGMTLFDDLNCIEVVDGEMYVTCLYNFVQPLIRYRLTDALRLRTSNGPFGKADILMGRDEDMLWFASDAGERDFLHPLAIEGFCIEGLRDFQFVQTGEASFTMLAETSEGADHAAIEAQMQQLMKEILEEKQLSYVRFAVEIVDHIRPDPRTGKKKLILTAKEACA